MSDLLPQNLGTFFEIYRSATGLNIVRASLSQILLETTVQVQHFSQIVLSRGKSFMLTYTVTSIYLISDLCLKLRYVCVISNGHASMPYNLTTEHLLCILQRRCVAAMFF